MPNKSLGPHWLKDRLVLEAIADSIPIHKDDLVLEVGPGLGTLTSVLLGHAKKVVAVEYDNQLAEKLPAQFPGKALEVLNLDFLEFDLSSLKPGYKVVANVPYYITSKIIERLVRSTNHPEKRQHMIEQGLKYVTRFSEQRQAEELMNLYRSLTEEKTI
jgi:16S rRNA (adenine1518-N6/adenine1519-N6)-dimethyltransferase